MYLTSEDHAWIGKIFKKIRKHYGKPKWEKKPLTLIPFYDPRYRAFAWYQYPRMGINFWACSFRIEVVGSLIHEYHHHLQDPDREDEDLYELEANYIAARDLHLFLPPPMGMKIETLRESFLLGMIRNYENLATLQREAGFRGEGNGNEELRLWLMAGRLREILKEISGENSLKVKRRRNG